MKLVYLLLTLSIASTPSLAQWTEKYPVNVVITTDNSIVQYLKANFGKIGEIAAGRIESFLKDPVQQAKMAVSAIDYLVKLNADTSKSENDKAKEFLQIIDADIQAKIAAGYSGQKQGSLDASAAFSPKYGVMRLTWKADRVGPMTCQLWQSGPQNGGQGTFSTVTMYEEGAYTVSRNGKTVATIAGWNGFGDKTYANSFDVGGFTLNLSVALPTPPKASNEIVFYDYDPYQGTVGTPLSYSITSNRTGCSLLPNGQGGTGAGAIGGRVLSSFYVDSDGDSVPDFIPKSVVDAARAELSPPVITPPPAQGLFVTQYKSYAGANRFIAVANTGTQVITNIAATCTISSNVYRVNVPYSSLPPGQSMQLIAVPVNAYGSGNGAPCGFRVTGDGASNSPLIEAQW